MATETILNRKALRDFHILERYEAGIELKGQRGQIDPRRQSEYQRRLCPHREGPGLSP